MTRKAFLLALFAAPFAALLKRRPQPPFRRIGKPIYIRTPPRWHEVLEAQRRYNQLQSQTIETIEQLALPWT
jgi:hypothetical protein